MIEQPLLKMENVSVNYPGHGENLSRGIEAINFSVMAGQHWGVAGETGAGKSTLARAAAALEHLSQGRVFLDGICTASAKLGEAITGEPLRQARKSFQIMFQDPASSLSPRLNIEMIVAEGALAHGLWQQSDVQDGVQKALEEVGLDGAMRTRFPHELSGGERRRVALARVKAVQPKLLILDEPTAGLDQENVHDILNLLQDSSSLGVMTLMVVSHDLSFLKYLCSNMAILRGGRIVEKGETQDIFSRPQEPYTQALVQASSGLEAWVDPS